MSNDPYAAATDFQDYHEDGPPRTSALAIWSLVCSLICCIPGLSSLGALFGVFALINIAKAEGRLKGHGLAIAGIVLGVLISIAWVGGAVVYQAASKQYVSFGELVVHIDNNEFDQARGMLTTTTRAHATDERFVAFRETYKAESGEHQAWPSGFIDGMTKIFPLLSERGKAQPNIPYSNPMPLPGDFVNGERIVWYSLNQNQMDSSGSRPSVINMGVMAEDGSLTWLIDPSTLNGPPPSELSAPSPSQGEATPEDDSAADVDDGEG